MAKNKTPLETKASSHEDNAYRHTKKGVNYYINNNHA